ncbi:MAG: DUF1127 domain-containing protein [Candidatus Sedimenticola sp. PURPLELP]
MNTQTLTIRKTHFFRQGRKAYSLGNSLHELFTTLRFLWQRQRQRRRLLEMEDHLLKDIGISRADALNEGEKPCWRN